MHLVRLTPKRLSSLYNTLEYECHAYSYLCSELLEVHFACIVPRPTSPYANMEATRKKTRQTCRMNAKRKRDGTLGGGAMQIKSQLAVFMVRFFTCVGTLS